MISFGGAPAHPSRPSWLLLSASPPAASRVGSSRAGPRNRLCAECGSRPSQPATFARVLRNANLQERGITSSLCAIFRTLPAQPVRFSSLPNEECVQKCWSAIVEVSCPALEQRGPGPKAYRRKGKTKRATTTFLSKLSFSAFFQLSTSVLRMC